LDLVKHFYLQTYRRQYGYSLRFSNSYYDVTSAPIIDVIGKSTDTMQDIFRIPASLEFQPLPFYYSTMDEL
jgi:hypothetical protein